MKPQPKPTKWRSEGYKKHIRQKPCRKCDKPGPSVAAHESFSMKNMKGTSTKVTDGLILPMCPPCHFERDHVKTDAEEFWGADLLFVAIDCIKWRDEYLIMKGMK